MENNNRYDEKTLQAIKELLTFDQDACFESVRKQIVKRIKSDRRHNKAVSQEEYKSTAMFLTTFYFTEHHIPSMFYTLEFVQKKYPELVEKIMGMVEEAMKPTREL